MRVSTSYSDYNDLTAEQQAAAQVYWKSDPSKLKDLAFAICPDGTLNDNLPPRLCHALLDESAKAILAGKPVTFNQLFDPNVGIRPEKGDLGHLRMCKFSLDK